MEGEKQLEKSRMATGSKLPKTKSILNFGGYDYLPQGQRKDGSTTWRCSDRDCEGRLLKKAEGDEDVEVLKDHSTELPSIKAAIIHLGMNCIKERAVNNPHESPEEIIKHGMLKASELMVAFMPSPNLVEECINSWKQPKEPRKDKEKTPKPKDKPEGRPTRTKSSLKLPRKRMKLSSAEDLASDEEESPRVRTKRSRSKSVPDLDDSDD